MFNSVRVRLTLWYTLVFGMLLIGFSLFIYIVLSNHRHAKLDHSISNAARTTANFFQSKMEENAGDAERAAGEALKALQLPDLHLAFYKGERLIASDHPEWRGLAISKLVSMASRPEGDTFCNTVDRFGKEGARLALLPVKAASDDDSDAYYIAVAEPLDDFAGQLEAIRQVFYFGLPATLLASAVGGFLLARKSLAPVVAMSNQAERISANNLHERLPGSNERDELGRLATVFNELLSRLDHSFENMRAFIADASHELRTPLSIIRGEADVALSQDRKACEYREALGIIQDEARQLSRLVDDMLELARADAGQRCLRAEEFYLNDLVEESCRAAQVLATQNGISLSVMTHSDLIFRGDEGLLRRMMLNLLDNAIKFTPSGGSVSVNLIREETRVKIVVSDTGIGIPAESTARIFERFYRINKARSRADGGSGLGLAIVRWAVEAHNGSINLTSQIGQGSTFTVTLPL